MIDDKHLRGLAALRDLAGAFATGGRILRSQIRDSKEQARSAAWVRKRALGSKARDVYAARCIARGRDYLKMEHRCRHDSRPSAVEVARILQEAFDDVELPKMLVDGALVATTGASIAALFKRSGGEPPIERPARVKQRYQWCDQHKTLQKLILVEGSDGEVWMTPEDFNEMASAEAEDAERKRVVEERRQQFARVGDRAGE